mmetsp:Transcript_9287/g.12316  ORF Transcript_9287/g.12316 Transcript_9287/m.12316 type:complete len:153 (-) Transcript_9287:1370-1828(-)
MTTLRALIRRLDDNNNENEEQDSNNGQQQDFYDGGQQDGDGATIEEHTSNTTLILVVVAVLALVAGALYGIYKYYLMQTGIQINESAKNVTADLIHGDEFDDESSPAGSPRHSNNNNNKTTRQPWTNTQMELVKPREQQNHNAYVHIGGTTV